MKCKENIKGQKERIAQLQAENETAKQNLEQKQEEVDKLHSAHKDQLARLTESLNLARKEIETVRHQEQDAALAAAEFAMLAAQCLDQGRSGRNCLTVQHLRLPCCATYAAYLHADAHLMGALQ